MISSWNINGIRAVLGKGELVGYLKKFDPDVICLNEIKVDEATIAKDKVNIK
jgi:exodeoxyribonuclease III